MTFGGAGAARAVAVAVAATVSLTGCVSTSDAVARAGEAVELRAPTATPDAEPSHPAQTPAPRAALITDELAGVGTSGPTTLDLAVPDSARSVVVTLSCEGGDSFTAELGESMTLGQGVLSGVCGGATELAWPLLPETDATLHLYIGEGVEWTASVAYSEAPFEQDAALAAECDAFSGIYSQIRNADDGYGFYQAFGADVWNDRVDAAAFDLDELADTSITDLAESFRALHTVIVERPAVAGGMIETTGVAGPVSAILDACNANHSAVVVLAEFGG